MKPENNTETNDSKPTINGGGSILKRLVRHVSKANGCAYECLGTLKDIISGASADNWRLRIFFMICLPIMPAVIVGIWLGEIIFGD